MNNIFVKTMADVVTNAIGFYSEKVDTSIDLTPLRYLTRYVKWEYEFFTLANYFQRMDEVFIIVFCNSLDRRFIGECCDFFLIAIEKH
jgi:hypothetical protein